MDRTRQLGRGGLYDGISLWGGRHKRRPGDWGADNGEVFSQKTGGKHIQDQLGMLRKSNKKCLGKHIHLPEFLTQKFSEKKKHPGDMESCEHSQPREGRPTRRTY